MQIGSWMSSSVKTVINFSEDRFGVAATSNRWCLYRKPKFEIGHIISIRIIITNIIIIIIIIM